MRGGGDFKGTDVLAKHERVYVVLCVCGWLIMVVVNVSIKCPFLIKGGFPVPIIAILHGCNIIERCAVNKDVLIVGHLLLSLFSCSQIGEPFVVRPL